MRANEIDSSERIDARQTDNQPSNDTDGPAHGDRTSNETSQIGQNGKQVRRHSLAARAADECGTVAGDGVDERCRARRTIVDVEDLVAAVIDGVGGEVTA
jgi:hypothetical protein